MGESFGVTEAESEFLKKKVTRLATVLARDPFVQTMRFKSACLQQHLEPNQMQWADLIASC
jgi:hypothetical protein